MKKCIYILCSLNLLFSLGCTIRNTTNKLIKVPVPERVEGQADVLELTAPKLDTVRVGFIGLGMRGISAVERFIHIPGTKIVALCDIRPECVDKSQKVLIDAGLPKAVTYTGNRLETSCSDGDLFYGARKTCCCRSTGSYEYGRDMGYY